MSKLNKWYASRTIKAIQTQLERQIKNGMNVHERDVFLTMELAERLLQVCKQAYRTEKGYGN